ncbi:hypothetical protein IAQ61_005816 [Plenodomus lingam]|uniref:Predicted protein n=1 Tax=Leptosphaeria maculans (strain JN3 / isolate v23.1.3 / race Av1-4-5-6-7-8) TaxID=985895 RepID=E4ZLZ3_LEPMJ|nr:predicted protein [Plenodomus lingam JN3]KAH9870342.1 hypothetical protein IAQ61_005816 [Plenodomus lingam]CBX92823.1 predicted protein [Plenodomus lingam JN3]
MAPTPVSDNPSTQTRTTASHNRTYWTKSHIALTIVFGLLFLALFLAALLFFLHRRSQAKKKSLSHRQSDSAALLSNEDKTHMFSRNRASSVPLYLDQDATTHSTNPQNTQPLTLVPLQITPIHQQHTAVPPSTITQSSGSGVTDRSTPTLYTSATTTTTITTSTITPSSTLLLSPVSPLSNYDPDMDIESASRARSASSASQRARYYGGGPLSGEVSPVARVAGSG